MFEKLSTEWLCRRKNLVDEMVVDEMTVYEVIVDEMTWTRPFRPWGFNFGFMYRSHTEFAYWSYKNLLISVVFFKNFKLHTPVISITTDWILMILYLLDSSRWEESNGSKIIFLASILIDLFQKMYFTIRCIWHTWEMFGILLNPNLKIFWILVV